MHNNWKILCWCSAQLLTRDCKAGKSTYFNLNHGYKHMFELLMICKINCKNEKNSASSFSLLMHWSAKKLWRLKLNQTLLPILEFITWMIYSSYYYIVDIKFAQIKHLTNTWHFIKKLCLHIYDIGIKIDYLLVWTRLPTHWAWVLITYHNVEILGSNWLGALNPWRIL